MNVRLIRFLISVLVVSLFVAFSGCDRGDEKKSTSEEKAKKWGEYVSSYTSGLISKDSKIHVRFVNDIVGDEKVGQNVGSVFSVNPETEGEATFVNKREIVFVPAKQFKSGQKYTATVLTGKLAGFPKDLDVFDFDFQVIKQDFEINVIGLVSEPENDTEMVLKGTLTTADKEDADLIEKILSASHGDTKLDIKWQHNVDGRNHEFSMGGIKRRDKNSAVQLIWDGAGIDVDSKGEHSVEVPPLGVFKVVSVKAVQGDKQYVKIEFSDNIDERQNLGGLIQSSKPGYTLRVEGNIVKLYPEETQQGEALITIDSGVKNTKGRKLGQRLEKSVSFALLKPQVRFVGKGVILPENEFLTIPFEAVNVDSVQVTTFRVYENNIGQFLQTNKLDGDINLERVGRYLWRKTIKLGLPEPNKWNRFSLDATQLLKENPGGLFRLTLSINRGNATYSCSEEDNNVPVAKEKPFVNHEDLNVRESSGWDFAEDYFGGNNAGNTWRDRRDPCKDAYYLFGSNVTSSRNFLASNIGIIAKRGEDEKIHVITTDLRSSQPMAGVEIDFMNFQNQKIGHVTTDNKGFAEAAPGNVPFYLTARKSGQIGYLKMSKGAALPVSHFDVGGEKVNRGIKGYIYGERDVWRPGDNIYLTFVLEDKKDVIPAKHPVTMRLYNPKGQMMQTLTNTEPVGDFYAFTMKTSADDLTGIWTAKAFIGGSTFSKTLKIETVVPNRLKVELDFGVDSLRKAEMPVKGKIFGQWLHGATAAGLKTDVAVRLRPKPTKFGRFTDFVFDDPARVFAGEKQTLFEGKLDDTGHAEFEKELWPGSDAPGMLAANFTTRVFEEGGAFSISHMSIPYYPYENFVGIKLPKGDQTRNMVLTDTTHTVEIASLNAQGEPVSLNKVQVTMYKIDWKWWWDKSGESLAQYAEASHTRSIKQDTVSTVDGKGKWEFEVKYPEWGRYLIRACDEEGKHCTGKVLYIDWPGWAGRAQEQSGPGANALTFTADKPEYKVGEVSKIQLPEATQGRALLTVENGTTILRQEWLEFGQGKTKIDLKLTKEMSPNVYVNVTLVQPHQDKKNDRPIRLYGIIPIKVNDPETKLQPVLKAADSWKPETKVNFEVSEEKGREMTYTVALVDEGLLGLTNFKTPDPHSHFYKKEALGVNTWDLYDLVAGAYGGELERLLALGGDEEAEDKETKDKRRFPPVVKFLGPFKLKAKQVAKHEVELPQYFGAVRVMVVAGEKGAYGSTDKSVFVRDNLTMLPTLPRVIGPDEELTVPVSVFAMEPDIKDVSVKIDTDEHFEIAGSDTASVKFAKPGEQLAILKLKVRPELGKGRVHFTAKSGKNKAEYEIYIDIRSPNPKTARYVRKTIKPGEEWGENIVPHGIADTNTVKIEVSSVPPINLEGRLHYLIRYPHGCVEQVTSSVFPQLYLPKFVKLDDDTKKEIEKNIHAAFDRLKQFQHPDGGFMYWPGNGRLNGWATSYVGHFLLEAEKVGYHAPPEMLVGWLEHQTKAAQSWVAGTGRSELDQAYRLYTLALVNKPELGAMNRLREASSLSSAARWQLGAAYSLAGLTSAANELVENASFEIKEYESAGATFGSKLRDQAIVLNSLATLGRQAEAEEMAREVSESLGADKWYSTQSVAFGLLAMAKYVGVGKVDEVFTFEHRIGSGVMAKVESKSPIYSKELKTFPLKGETVKVRNTSQRVLYASILVEGIPKAGEEKASSKGLSLEVHYTDTKDAEVDVASIKQGADVVAELRVTNNTQRKLENIALTHIVPSGWEIHNSRLNDDGKIFNSDMDYQDIRDDRVYTYFSLKPGEEKIFSTLLNASYLGKYYLPTISVEEMYDAEKHARIKGQWVEVVKAENE